MYIEKGAFLCNTGKVFEECNYDGPCAGTCEKCDKEAAYLRDKLFEIPENKRIYPQNFLDDWNKILCMEK